MKTSLLKTTIILLCISACTKNIEPTKIEQAKNPAENLTFSKLAKTFSSGGTFTNAEILSNIQGEKAGYTLKEIKALNPNDVVSVVGTKPNLSLSFLKVGNFTATLILEHDTKSDATIAKAVFEINKPQVPQPDGNLSFSKLSKTFEVGKTFTSTEILNNVRGEKTGYTLKEIKDLNPDDVVNVAGTKPNLSLSFLKAGNFTATLILEHDTKAEATITKAVFEVNKPQVAQPDGNLTFSKLSKTFGVGKTFTSAEILNNVKGEKGGYTLKEIRDLTPNDVVNVVGTKPNLSLSFLKAGSFTATLVLEHDTKKDQIFTKAAFEIVRVVLEELNITDPLYKDQWYLKNTGQFGGKPGIDLNVEPLWKAGYNGRGMKIALFDTWIDPSHPDLKANFPAQNSINYHSDKEQCKSDNVEHGTNTAGIIAASANNIGIRGIAYSATLYGYGLLHGSIPIDDGEFDRNFIQVLNRAEHKEIAVYNGSIGDIDHIYSHQAEAVTQAMDKVTRTGFNGKGGSFVFAAGNNRSLGKISLSSNSSFLNYYATIGVNSLIYSGVALIPPFATFGPNIWLIAPGVSIKTTDLPGACGTDPGDYGTYGATSSATPMVSGVIALLREAYPNLTWRDVKLILAESARKLKPRSLWPYQTTGNFYSNPSQQQKYSYEMAFGLVDAKAAFDLARSWTLLPPMKKEVIENTPALNTSGTNIELETSLIVSSSQIKFIESIVVEIDIEKSSNNKLTLNDVGLSLVSPDNKTAIFFRRATHGAELESADTKLRFLANTFLGSSVVEGTWKLKIQQQEGDRITQIKAWKLIVRGH